MAQRAIPSLLGKLATLVLIAVAFVVALIGTVMLSLHSPNVKVPEVVGKSASDAESALADAGLNVRTRARRFSTEVKPDTVLDQTPHAGIEVKKGQTIAIVLSRGEAKEGESSVGVKQQEADSNANQTAQASGGETNTNNANNANNTNKPKKTNKNKNANNSNNANPNANGAGNVNSNLNTNLVVNSTNTSNARNSEEPAANNRNAAPPRNANTTTNAPRNLNANTVGATTNLNANAIRSRTVMNRNANAGGTRNSNATRNANAGRNANRRPPAD